MVHVLVIVLCEDACRESQSDNGEQEEEPGRGQAHVP